MANRQTDDNAEPITYRQAGVDIDAGNALVDAIKPMVKATRRPGADSDLGGFGGLFDLKRAGFTDPVLVACNDGVGTKLKIAIETGRHETIGIDLVAMCVNDLIVQGAEPLFFLDYLATAHLDVPTATAAIAGIAEGCKQARCALIGGETAEMPSMYHGEDYDLAGFSVGAVERDELLPGKTIASGDVIIGLHSSGVHSNGYSLVRRLVTEAKLNWHDEAPWQPGTTLAESLLAPTRIYVQPMLAALKLDRARPKGPAIKALSHITGGGLTENLPRVLPSELTAHIDLTAWQPPAVFNWLAQAGRLDDSEMLRTFNCGIGMAVVVANEASGAVIDSLTAAGETPQIIGELSANDTQTSPVSYTGSLDLAK